MRLGIATVVRQRRQVGIGRYDVHPGKAALNYAVNNGGRAGPVTGDLVGPVVPQNAVVDLWIAG